MKRINSCIETIACLENKLLNLSYHQNRLNTTLKKCFKTDTKYNLSDIKIPDNFKNGYFKCRIVYNKDSFNVSFSEYTTKQIENVALIYDNGINYDYKYENRTNLNTLLNLGKKKIGQHSVNEVIIVKNGLVTDFTIANILFRKNTVWYTPKCPLLKGTYRECLIDNKAVTPVNIAVNDSIADYDNLITDFESYMPINAMMRGEHKELPIESIVNL